MVPLSHAVKILRRSKNRFETTMSRNDYELKKPLRNDYEPEPEQSTLRPFRAARSRKKADFFFLEPEIKKTLAEWKKKS
jgi:hypothetical protein